MTNVVLEGPDGSGKSTLAAHLAAETGLHVQQGEGPPKFPGEIEDRASRYLDMRQTIFDRHPIVSQPIYAVIRGEQLSARIVAMESCFYLECNHLLIYCRSTDPSRHVVKAGENPAHVEALTRRYDELVALYDRWALARAHVIYHIGDDLTSISAIVRCVTRW